jgi:hypothetical protein
MKIASEILEQSATLFDPKFFSQIPIASLLPLINPPSVIRFIILDPKNLCTVKALQLFMKSCLKNPLLLGESHFGSLRITCATLFNPNFCIQIPIASLLPVMNLSSVI